jgi:hypothetical protein
MTNKKYLKCLECLECRSVFKQKKLCQKFCSKKCADNNWHRRNPRIKKLKNKKCLFCKKDFKTYVNKARFCSGSCALKYNWRNKSVYRTKKYSTDKSKFFKKWHSQNNHPRGMLGKKQSERCKKLSSERCKKRLKNKHPNWKGGSQVYWNKIAVKKMKDVLNICWYGKRFNKENECKGRLVVHHKDGDITNNRKYNLIKICEHHHLSFYHKSKCKDKINMMNKIRLKKIKENPNWWKNIKRVK